MQKISAYRHSINLQSEVSLPSVPLYQHIVPTTRQYLTATDKLTAREQVVITSEVVQQPLTDALQVGETVELTTVERIVLQNYMDCVRAKSPLNELSVEVVG